MTNSGTQGPVLTIMGGIASGKTTIARNLASFFGIPLWAETPTNNPFLPLFGFNPNRWCFANQVWFLERAAQSLQMASQAGGIVDHTVAEVVDIHSEVFRQQGWLTDNETKLLTTLQFTLTRTIPPPDLTIILTAPPEILLNRVASRARVGDRLPTVLELTQIQDARERFTKTLRGARITIDSHQCDFRQGKGLSETQAIIAESLKPK